MDIRKHVYIWINKILDFTTYKDCIIVDGGMFDGERGFGDEEWRSYEGELSYISKNFKITVMGGVHHCHTQRSGIKWSIDKQDNFPNVPFLLTNNNNLKHIYDGEVSITQTEFIEDVFEHNKGYDFTLISENMIGVIKKINNNFYLELFAEIDFDSDTILNEKFVFVEWEDESCIINW
jgi:hypothetical protein